MGRSLTVIVPCYNEELGIRKNIFELEEHLQSHGYDWELLFVNDGSKDGTGKILDTEAKRNKCIRVVHHPRNLGRGAGLKTGFANASKEVIVTLDADLSYAPYHIERLLETMDKDGADIVQASPYRKGGSTKNVPFVRLFISKWSNWLLTKTIFRDYTVVTCIARAYKREAIQSIFLEANGKEIHLEILSKAKDLGMRVDEIPAELKWRKEKPKKSASKTPSRKPSFNFPRMAFQHIVYGLNEAPLFFVGVFGTLFMLISAVLAIIFGIQWLGGTLNSQRPLFIIMVLLFLAGIQTLLFSFLAGQNRQLKKEITVTQSLLLKKK